MENRLWDSFYMGRIFSEKNLEKFVKRYYFTYTKKYVFQRKVLVMEIQENTKKPFMLQEICYSKIFVKYKHNTLIVNFK